MAVEVSSNNEYLFRVLEVYKILNVWNFDWNHVKMQPLVSLTVILRMLNTLAAFPRTLTVQKRAFAVAGPSILEWPQ